MILLWLLFCFVHNLKAQISTPTTPSKPSIDIKSKPIMCDYRNTEWSNPNGLSDPNIPQMPPETMPCECEIIVYEDFEINNKSVIDCDTKILQRLTSVGTVMIGLYRGNYYNDWTVILKDKKLLNKEVDILIDFAKKYNVIGYRLHKLSPEDDTDTFSKNVGIKIVDYIKLLKQKSNLIVGYGINEFGSVLKNQCVTPFAELNGVVDFYTIRTYFMNYCDNNLYNGLNPIKLREHGETYMMSMEEVWKYLEESKCDLKKVYLMGDIIPAFNRKFMEENGQVFVNYNQVCCGIKTDDMCIPDSNELYAKGSYIKQVNCGLTIKFINLDNFEDVCGCGTFVGTRNLYAGYYGKEKIACAKFDVQKAPKGNE